MGLRAGACGRIFVRPRFRMHPEKNAPKIERNHIFSPSYGDSILNQTQNLKNSDNFGIENGLLNEKDLADSLRSGDLKE